MAVDADVVRADRHLRDDLQIERTGDARGAGQSGNSRS
jgi:hypothetical protein